MALVKCPHCGEIFEVDAKTLSSVVEEEVTRRLQASNEAAVKAAVEDLERKHAMEIEHVKSEADLLLSKEKNESEAALLKANAEGAAKVKDTKNAYEIELAKLKADTDRQVEAAKANLREQDARELEKIRGELNLANERNRLLSESIDDKVSQAKAEGLNEGQIEIAKVKADALAEQRRLEDEIVAMKEMRSRLSTKLIGESLERHCENEFKRAKATGAFSDATLEKDNVAVSQEGDRATKGDFIYRQFDEDGNEVLSIMFEMKTEDESSDAKNKKTNESHMAKLDRDRKKKNCEYAVLVSTLEADSEIYNAGIVDVSLFVPYKNMYVVRPQCFISIISLLRSLASERMKHNIELADLADHQKDVKALYEDTESWVSDVLKTDELFRGNIERGLKALDEAIARLEKTRDELRKGFSRTFTMDKKVESTSVVELASRYESLRGFLPA